MSLPIMSGTARLTADPQLRITPSGMCVCTVGLAFNSRKRNDAGEWVDGDVFYVTGTIFRDEAEHVAESLTKGTEVVITGRLKTRKYTDKDNNERSVVDLLVDSIGPTMRWTTVKVNKMVRRSDVDAAETARSDDQWANAAPVGVAAGFDDETPRF